MLELEVHVTIATVLHVGTLDARTVVERKNLLVVHMCMHEGITFWLKAKCTLLEIEKV